MPRNQIYTILILCATLSISANSVFAQIKPLDKKTIADFEKSIAQGKFDEIERPLLNFAVANPNDSQILNLLANVRFRQNRLSEAAALYKRILTLDANSASAKINLANIAFLSNQTDEARRMLDGVDETSISDASIRLNLATAFLQIGEPQKSLEIAEKLFEKTKNSDALPIIAMSYAKLKNESKLREIIPQMKRAAANSKLTLQNSEALQIAGMNREAIDLLKSALTNSPNNFDILIALGKLEIGAKDLTAAKLHLSQAAKIQPRGAKLLLAQALLEEGQGNSKNALDLLKQARLIEPNSSEILSQFVISAMRSNQPRSAFEAARILAESKPDEPEYLYLLGAAALNANDLPTAESNLQRLMQLRPTDSRGCLALGLTLAAQPDKIENARQQLRQCLEFDAENVEAKYQLGLSYKAQGENQKAVEYFEETVKIAPNYADALRDLGAVYLQTGAETKARTVLEKAVALAPDDADTHFQLSRLYNLIGESALAKKHLEMFQKLKNASNGSM